MLNVNYELLNFGLVFFVWVRKGDNLIIGIRLFVDIGGCKQKFKFIYMNLNLVVEKVV